MMDTSELMNTLPDGTEDNLFVLFEAGAQSEQTFLDFKSLHEGELHSLYLHPQLTGFQNVGPWLLKVESKEQLMTVLKMLPGCTAVIVSSLYPPYLAIQLSRGCTIVDPENTTALVRFYARQVIEILAVCDDKDWHAFLFNGIAQWWLPAGTCWNTLVIAPSTAQHPIQHVIRLDAITWQKIADDPEVSSVLNEWQKMPSSQHFPPCAQRDMVVKALEKAKSAGMVKGPDRKLYALYYLSGGREMLVSSKMEKFMQKVSHGEFSLEQVLIHYSAERV